MNRYTVGAQVVVEGVFTASTGPIDPGTVKLDVVTPSGISTTYTYNGISGIVRVDTGTYTYSIDTTDQSGRWQYRWWTPPTPTGTAAQSNFVVDPFPPQHI
jgi:hypothetical protein